MSIERLTKNGLNTLWDKIVKSFTTKKERKEDIQDIALNQQTLGYTKKNLLKITIESQTLNNGVTITVNPDKSITFNSEKTTSNRWLNLGTVELDIGDYILNGNPSGLPDDFYLYIEQDAFIGSASGGVDRKFSITKAGECKVLIRIPENTSISNVTFYPMVRSADILDNTYEPYVENVDTRFKNYLPLTGGDITGETTVNGLRIKKFHLDDNAGLPKLLLMFDITDWYTSTTSGLPCRGFVGSIYSMRGNGGMLDHTATVYIGASWVKSNKENGTALLMRTDTSFYIPCIAKDVENEKYYLALKVSGGYREIILQGMFSGTYIGTQIYYIDSTTLPTGYEIVQDDYKIIPPSGITTSTTITETGRYVVDAIELNASISGTLANRISKLEQQIGTLSS